MRDIVQGDLDEDANEPQPQTNDQSIRRTQTE